MNSKLTFLLAVIFTSLGLATVFFEVPVIEEYPPVSHGFFQGFCMGLGPVLFAAAYVRWKKEKQEAA